MGTILLKIPGANHYGACCIYIWNYDIPYQGHSAFVVLARSQTRHVQSIDLIIKTMFTFDRTSIDTVHPIDTHGLLVYGAHNINRSIKMNMIKI